MRLVDPLCTVIRPLLVVSVPPFAQNASFDGPYTPLLIFTNLPHPNPHLYLPFDSTSLISTSYPFPSMPYVELRPPKTHSHFKPLSLFIFLTSCILDYLLFTNRAKEKHRIKFYQLSIVCISVPIVPILFTTVSSSLQFEICSKKLSRNIRGSAAAAEGI